MPPELHRSVPASSPHAEEGLHSESNILSSSYPPVCTDCGCRECLLMMLLCIIKIFPVTVYSISDVKFPLCFTLISLPKLERRALAKTSFQSVCGESVHLSLNVFNVDGVQDSVAAPLLGDVFTC